MTGWRSGPFGDAARALRREGVRPLLMRDDPECIDELDELDVLVAPRQLARAVDALESAGWVLSDRGLFHPRKRAFLALDGKRLLKLDLHADFVDRALVYLDADWAIETSLDEGRDYALPTRETFAAHVALHVVLGKRVIPDKLRDRFHAACGAGLDLELVRAQTARFGLAELTLEILGAPECLDQPERVARARATARRVLLRRPANLARQLGQGCAWSVGRAVGLRRGFLIAVIGPDGVGKSSFINALVERLHDWDVPARTVYMGPWEPTRLPSSRLLAWLGANPLDEIPGTTQDYPPFVRFTKGVKGTLRRHAWYASAWLDLWARYVGHALPRMLLRRVVIADRYIYDVEVGYYNALVHNSPRLRRLLCDLVPRPRLTVLLDDDPERIVARKPEYPLEVIAAARAAYLALAERRGITVLRTDRPASELAERFLVERWRQIARWRRG